MKNYKKLDNILRRGENLLCTGQKNSKDPLETSGQDRRDAGRMIENLNDFSSFSPADASSILPPCFMAILAHFHSRVSRMLFLSSTEENL